MNFFCYGYGGSVKLSEELRPLIQKLGCTLTTISEWDDADIKWDRKTVLKHLKQADVIILPCNFELQPAKSANRMTQAFALGKPVICNPLHSYLDVLKQTPENCISPALIVTTIEEWEKAIVFLRDNVEARKQMSDVALKISEKYSIASIAKKWLVALQDTDKIDIIIPNYNNKTYLELCINSIIRNTSHPYNLVVSDSGSNADTWEYLKTLKCTVLGKQNERLNFSQACNAGIKSCNSKYFVILNSDVIVSENWEYNMLDKMNTIPNLAICGVLSNCNRGWLYTDEYNMNVDGLELVPAMKQQQIEPILQPLYQFMKKSNKDHQGQFVEREWVAFYANMHNRAMFEKVGYLDPKFNNGHEDLDHCIRTKKMGFKIGDAIDSFIFHFGGISRAAYEIEGNEQYKKEDLANNVYFNEKWGF